MTQYDSPSAREHRAAAPESVRSAVVTVSDTRTLEDDRSGALIADLLAAAGHSVVQRVVVTDESGKIEAAVRAFAADDLIDAVLVTGGTGVAARDVTPDAVAAMLTKELPGFGELFRMLSYEQIGAAAMLSRAVGGVIDRTVVLAMPGSTAGVRLAMEKLILPELGHLVELAGK